MALVGDAAGYVTKSSGEGIYFAAKSGRMCAEEIVAASGNGQRIPSEKDLKVYLKKWDKKYGATYKVLEILQNVFYSNDPAREAFVEMCDDKDVQRLTFDSYLYKRVVPVNPWQTLKLTLLTVGAYLRGQAFAPSGYKPVPSAVRSEAEMAEFAREALLTATQVTSPASRPQALGGNPESPQAQSGEREPNSGGQKVMDHPRALRRSGVLP